MQDFLKVLCSSTQKKIILPPKKKKKLQMEEHSPLDNLSKDQLQAFSSQKFCCRYEVSVLLKLLVYPGVPPSHTIPVMYLLPFKKRHVPMVNVSSHPVFFFVAWPGGTCFHLHLPQTLSPSLDFLQVSVRCACQNEKLLILVSFMHPFKKIITTF